MPTVAATQTAKAKKYLVWLCSWRFLMYPIEYTVVGIHRTDERTAKNCPRASTLKTRDMAGERATSLGEYSTIFPARTSGISEATTANFVVAAMMLQNSL